MKKEYTAVEIFEIVNKHRNELLLKNIYLNKSVQRKNKTINYLRNKLADCDNEYIEACHKEINHLKKYTAHLITCDKTISNNKNCSCGLK